jgi:hypothetical protein
MTFPRFPISFAHGQVALAVRAGTGTDLAAAIRGMGLTTGVPTIVLVGTGTRPSQVARLAPLLEKVVVRVAEAVEATVVDDGSGDGVPALIGQIRTRKKAGFPLLGVAPDDGRDSDGRNTDGGGLDPEHSHFVLVPVGSDDALPRWMATVADAVAGQNRSVALVTGGGERAWDHVRANLTDGRIVMAVARSGGVADHLAAAVAGRPADERAVALVRSGRICAVDPGQGAASVAEQLRTALSRPNQIGPGGGVVVG